MLVAGAGLLGAAAHGGDAGTSIRKGGTFNIALAGGGANVDPALLDLNGFTLIEPTCARLMTYPGQPPPQGFPLVPEVAKPSRDQAASTGPGFPGPDGGAVVLRCAAHAAHRRGRTCDIPRRRPVLRRGERARATRRAQAQPVLPWLAAASRRPLRRRPPARLPRGRARPHR